ncbi:MAG: WG repeat-containing protein [Bacteroidales bacterium]|jgi:hypothetical protein|nr:WG repeat-containing protein [Bacteroidales bacterium]
MRLLQVFLLILLFNAGFCQESSPLFIVRQDQLYGLIDSSGSVVLEPQFTAISYDPQFRIFIVTGQSGKAAFASSQNAFITGFYDEVQAVSLYYFIVTRNGLCGVVDRSGKMIVPIQYSSIRRSDSDRFFCSNNASVAVYNNNGSLEVNIPSEEIIEYCGYYIFKNRDYRFGVVSVSGEKMIEDVYSNFLTGDGLIELRSEDSTAILHASSGRVVHGAAGCSFRFIKDASRNNLATPFYLLANGSSRQWHSVYSHKNLDVDLSEAVIYATALSDLYLVNTTFEWLIDNNGVSVTDEKYEDIFYFRDSLFVIENNGLRGLFKPGTGVILQPIYKSFRTLTDTITGNRWTLALSNPDGYRFLDQNFREINDQLYFAVNLVHGRGIIVNISLSEVILLDTDGRRVGNAVYSAIQPLSDGFWKVYRNGFCGLMDSQAKLLTEICYDDITMHNSRLKCVREDRIEYYRWNGSSFEPLINFSNFRQLDVTGTQLLSLIGTRSSQLALVWRRDSVLKKFGLYDVFNKRFQQSPVYDYAKMDQLRDISLTGIFGDTSYFRLGPLTFMGRIRFGVIDHKTGQVIAPNEFMFIYFNQFQRHFSESNSDLVTPYYNSDRNFAVAIDTDGNWRTISFTGTTYNPDVQFIDVSSGTRKVWRFDSCYVSNKRKRITDKKICNVNAAFAPLLSFLKPADAYTEAAIKDKKLSVFAPDADSLVLQKGLASRLDEGLNDIPLVYFRPLFVYKYHYPSILEYRNRLFCNVLIFESERRFFCIDSTGYVITDSAYSRIWPFSEDLAMVKMGSRYGFIDPHGALIIENKYRKASSFSEGKAAVSIKGGRYGYIGTDGAWIIEPAYREALAFSEGLAPVKPGNLFGYVDESGKMILKPAWLRANSFINGTAVVFNKRGFGLIDKSGNELLKCRYNRITPPDTNGNRMIVRKASQLVNASGDIITKKSRIISDAGNGYYSVKKVVGFSLIRSDGSEVAHYNSDRPLLVGDEKVIVTKKNRLYYYDLAANQLLGPYYKAAPFVMNRALVSTRDETMVIDSSGKILKILYRKRMSFVTSFDENGLAIVRAGSVFMLIDDTGAEFYNGNIKPRYAGNGVYILFHDGYFLYNHRIRTSYPFSKWSLISMPSCGRFVTGVNGKFGFSDVYGQYHVRPQYTRIERVSEGIYRVYYGDKTGYIRYDGKVIWELSR